MSPVLAPERVIIVFVATVNPKTNTSVSLSIPSAVFPNDRAAASRPFIIPSVKLRGVDKAFPVANAPFSSMATTSVKVPPVSTPTTYDIFHSPCKYYENKSMLDSGGDHQSIFILK
jgi:hypothetical protein